MTDKEKKSKIADILMDFQEEYNNEVINRPMLASIYAGDILSFIDSLQEESVGEDLEEAAKHYLYSNILYDDVYVGNPTDKDCIEMFKAGAKWQKEQMMVKAVDAQCFGFRGAALFSFKLPADNYLVGSEVKVIVIKKQNCE